MILQPSRNLSLKGAEFYGPTEDQIKILNLARLGRTPSATFNSKLIRSMQLSKMFAGLPSYDNNLLIAMYQMQSLSMKIGASSPPMFELLDIISFWPKMVPCTMYTWLLENGAMPRCKANQCRGSFKPQK